MNKKYKCSACGIEKDESEFYFDKANNRPKQPCKSCTKNKTRQKKDQPESTLIQSGIIDSPVIAEEIPEITLRDEVIDGSGSSGRDIIGDNTQSYEVPNHILGREKKNRVKMSFYINQAIANDLQAEVENQKSCGLIVSMSDIINQSLRLYFKATK